MVPGLGLGQQGSTHMSPYYEENSLKIQGFYLIGKKTILTYSTKKYLLKSAISNKRVGSDKYSSLTLT